MTTATPSGQNIGELIRGGVLTTREVLAIAHQLCRDATGAFPQSPDELWLTATGELRVVRSDARPINPRRAVASLLDAMLPAEDVNDADRAVTPALRQLPSRLRETAAQEGPRDRDHLMTILAWHLDTDPREVLRQLTERLRAGGTIVPAEPTPVSDVQRDPATVEGEPVSDVQRDPATVEGEPVSGAQRDPLSAVQPQTVSVERKPVSEERKPVAAVPRQPASAVQPPPVSAVQREPAATVQRKQEVVSSITLDLDLFPQPTGAIQPSPYESTTKGRRNRVTAVVTLAAVALLLVAIGSASYWFVRDDAKEVDRSRADAVAAPVYVPPTAIPPANSPSAAEVSSDIGEARDAQPLDLDVGDGAFSPAFASTGRELFFHAGHNSAGRLLVASVDERGTISDVTAVRTDAARNYHPRISPDGRWIAFDSDRDGERGVYVAHRDGSRLQRVSGPGYGAVPSWSPDMKSLAFIRAEPGRPRVWNLWLRDLATGTMQRHTAFRSGQVWGASWFPDGRTLCYSHEQQLVISSLDRGDEIVIDSPLPGHLVRTPAVSPDGQRVVFQVLGYGVWLLDVRTRAMRRILDDPTAEEFAWSPNGDRIAYHSRRDGDWKIWLMAFES